MALERFFDILEAQKQNIARIETDLVLNGTDSEGNQIKLYGPAPTLVRTFDDPLRFTQDDALENWERIITLVDNTDAQDDRIVRRNDRFLSYQIQCLVRLLPSEVQADRAAIVQNSVRQSTNPLGVKRAKLKHDIVAVLFDNMHLATPECPQGLVDDVAYRYENVSPTTEYPQSMFVITVTCRATAY